MSNDAKLTLKEWLIKTKTSQKELAIKCEMSKSRISQVVNNGTDSLTMALLILKVTDDQVDIKTLVME